jgi:hypothetical protein
MYKMEKYTYTDIGGYQVEIERIPKREIKRLIMNRLSNHKKINTRRARAGACLFLGVGVEPD